MPVRRYVLAMSAWHPTHFEGSTYADSERFSEGRGVRVPQDTVSQAVAAHAALARAATRWCVFPEIRSEAEAPSALSGVGSAVSR